MQLNKNEVSVCDVQIRAFYKMHNKLNTVGTYSKKKQYLKCLYVCPSVCLLFWLIFKRLAGT